MLYLLENTDAVLRPHGRGHYGRLLARHNTSTTLPTWHLFVRSLCTFVPFVYVPHMAFSSLVYICQVSTTNIIIKFSPSNCARC